MLSLAWQVHWLLLPWALSAQSETPGADKGRMTQRPRQTRCDYAPRPFEDECHDSACKCMAMHSTTAAWYDDIKSIELTVSLNTVAMPHESNTKYALRVRRHVRDVESKWDQLRPRADKGTITAVDTSAVARLPINCCRCSVAITYVCSGRCSLCPSRH